MLVGGPSGEPAGVAPAEPLRAALRGEPDPQPAPRPAPRAAQAPERRPVQPVPAPRIADAVPPAPTLSAPASPVSAVAAAAASSGGEVLARATSELANVALAPAEPRSGPDAVGLRQYRLALAGEARRFRSYPEAARREGAHGTAEVRISVGLGAQRQTELVRSSGHALLDTVALDMLRSAAARTTLPESLRGQEFAILLPVVFEVED